VKSWQAELFLFFVCFIWGATFLFTKLGLEDCPPSLFLIFRFSIALILSLVFFGHHLKHLDKQTLINGTILGSIFGIGFLLQTYGLKYTSVSKSAFITGMTVPFTPFVFWFIRRKKIQFWSIIGVVIASLGLLIFTNPEFDNINFGDFLTLLSAICWAFYMTFMDKFTKGKSGFSLTAILVIFHFLASTPLAVIAFFMLEYSTLHLNISTNLITGLAFNGILASFAVTFIHTGFQRFTTPVKAALIFSLEPIIANVLAIIVINEILNSREYLGGAILFIGVLASEFGGVVFKFLKRKLI
jgi:drug/metabolite transporter (DMT)-like permease